MKFQMYSTLTSGFDEAAKGGQGAGSAEIDEIKRMLVETNPFLLILTAVVSVLHMVYVLISLALSPLTDTSTHILARFEMLAFSSDVRLALAPNFLLIRPKLYLNSHWKNKKELTGVSVR